MLVVAIGAYSALFVSLLVGSTLASPESAADRAMATMILGLLVVWVVVAGSVMYAGRNRISSVVRSIPLDWRLKFVLFATALALLEEAVTVTMTNLAPAFGSVAREAHITASTNYVHVVLFHSVVVFVPMFVCWAYLLSRYAFEPVEAFLLFGLLGTISEATVAPVAALGGFWFFVYGLMVYLPAYAIPPRVDARRPTPRHYVLAVVAPIVVGAVASVPVIAVREALGIELWRA